jgi:methylated-DNA-protein-cysteine methyltransferase-like protein
MGTNDTSKANRSGRAASDGADQRPTRSYDRIYAVIGKIPRGRVATYGQIAVLAGLPRQPRLVGYALHALPQSSVLPWHRVINAQGRVSPRAGEPGGSIRQRLLLEQEGVTFDARGRVSLERFGWRPRPRRSSSSPSPRARR